MSFDYYLVFQFPPQEMALRPFRRPAFSRISSPKYKRLLPIFAIITAGSLLILAAEAQVASRPPQLAITFDDLPAHGPLPTSETRMDVATKILKALHDAKLPPTYGFVNEVAI